MQIERHGSRRNCGSTKTSLSFNSPKWDGDTESVKFTAYFVRDFDDATEHDWYVSVTLDELASMLEAAATAVGGADSEIIAATFSQSLTPMLRLATECSAHAASLAEEDY